MRDMGDGWMDGWMQCSGDSVLILRIFVVAWMHDRLNAAEIWA
jgi:hypothetical protein